MNTDTEDLVNGLLDEVELGRVEADEVLAYLAHAHHEDHGTIIEAREAGLDIGSVGCGAHALKARIEDALTS